VAREKKDIKPEYATRDDVERAVELLSSADQLRLTRFARYRIRGLGRMAIARDHEDLLREAITSTWIGAEGGDEGRRWKKNTVSFVHQLLGAMRSIASHWKAAHDEDEAYLDSEVAVETENGEVLSLVENAPSGAPSQERVLIAKEKLNAVYQMFLDDDDAALVIEGIKEGWTGPEIVERLGLSQKRYEAAIKRIRYRVR
jgi:DNA-directed RNA polymerase specialized sigma24 family protein